MDNYKKLLLQAMELYNRCEDEYNKAKSKKESIECEKSSLKSKNLINKNLYLVNAERNLGVLISYEELSKDNNRRSLSIGIIIFLLSVASFYILNGGFDISSVALSLAFGGSGTLVSNFCGISPNMRSKVIRIKECNNRESLKDDIDSLKEQIEIIDKKIAELDQELIAATEDFDRASNALEEINSDIEVIKSSRVATLDRINEGLIDIFFETDESIKPIRQRINKTSN